MCRRITGTWYSCPLRGSWRSFIAHSSHLSRATGTAPASAPISFGDAASSDSAPVTPETAPARFSRGKRSRESSAEHPAERVCSDSARASDSLQVDEVTPRKKSIPRPSAGSLSESQSKVAAGTPRTIKTLSKKKGSASTKMPAPSSSAVDQAELLLLLKKAEETGWLKHINPVS